MADLYLIWSYEHRAWWRPDSRGYTWDVAQAGLYTREEGEEIVAGHTDPLHEAMVPARAALEAFEVAALERKSLEHDRCCSLRRCLNELRGGTEGDPRKLQARRLSMYPGGDRG